MKKTDKMPIWVYLAFSSIDKKKWAVLLLWSNVIFSFYCIPWPLFFDNQGLLKKIFLITSWGWLAMMVPITIWYWISLRWMDKNSGWESKLQ